MIRRMIRRAWVWVSRPWAPDPDLFAHPGAAAWFADHLEAPRTRQAAPGGRAPARVSPGASWPAQDLPGVPGAIQAVVVVPPATVVRLADGSPCPTPPAQAVEGDQVVALDVLSGGTTRYGVDQVREVGPFRVIVSRDAVPGVVVLVQS